MESFKKKLYIPRNTEGEPNTSELKFLHDLEKILSEEFENFVGLVPIGSTMTGYSTTNSDIDTFVLYDWPQETQTPDIEFPDRGAKYKFKKKIAQKTKGIAIKAGKKLHIVLKNINPELLFKALDESSGFDYAVSLQEVAYALSILTQLGVGVKIQYYREVFLKWLNSLSQTQKETIRKDVISYLSGIDSKTKEKRIARNMPPDEMQNVLEERKKMWAKRFDKIWASKEK